MKKFRRKVLDMLMSNNSGSSLRQQLLDGAPFRSSLLYTAVPQRAASGTTATFTRATTSTWPNNDGYMVTGVAGEIGFVGARRVRNLVTKSEDLTSGWSANNAGSVTATTITFTAANNDGWVITAFTPIVGNTYRWSALVSTVSGTKNIRFRAGGAALSADIPITTTPTRVSALFTSVTAGGNYGIYNESAGGAATINCTQMQLEDVTGQTTQTAGEYVSVGVASSPYYHGSFVDGVKCFATDISGNPIPSTTMLGYQAQGARTNLCLQSNAFTTTWTKDATLTLTQNAVGPDGATSAWTLTDASAVGASYISQDITLTAASYTAAFFVKKTTGAQASYPVALFYLAATTGLAGVTIDTTNGVATAWTAYTGFTGVNGSATCVSYNSTYWRVSLTFTGTAAAWTLRLYPAGTTNATQSTGTLDLTAQGSAVFYGAQVELGSFASSYIPTTTIAVARNADVLTYSGGDIPNLKTLLCDFERASGVSSQGAQVTLFSSATNYATTYLDTASTLYFQGAVTSLQWQQTASNAYTPGTRSKVVWSMAANDIKMAKDGVAQTPDASASMPTVASLQVGYFNTGLYLNGNIGGIYGWTRNFSQSELNAVTA